MSDVTTIENSFFKVSVEVDYDNEPNSSVVIELIGENRTVVVDLLGGVVVEDVEDDNQKIIAEIEPSR